MVSDGLSRAEVSPATPRLKRGRAVVAHGATPPAGTAPHPAIAGALLMKQSEWRFRASPSYY